MHANDRIGIPWEYFNLISNGFLPKGEKAEDKVAEARSKYDAALADKILALPENERPELIVLAGWMHVFAASFLTPLGKAGIKVINLHPALPGALSFPSIFNVTKANDRGQASTTAPAPSSAPSRTSRQASQRGPASWCTTSSRRSTAETPS